MFDEDDCYIMSKHRLLLKLTLTLLGVYPRVDLKIDRDAWSIGHIEDSCIDRLQFAIKLSIDYSNCDLEP